MTELYVSLERWRAHRSAPPARAPIGIPLATLGDEEELVQGTALLHIVREPRSESQRLTGRRQTMCGHNFDPEHATRQEEPRAYKVRKEWSLRILLLQELQAAAPRSEMCGTCLRRYRRAYKLP